MSRGRRLGTAMIALVAIGAAPSKIPRRIVSLDMCADELVIALADRDQIAGLTEWARDPMLSWYAARARTLPYTHRTAEEVLALRPDVVIGAPPRTAAALGPLAARGTALVAMPYAEDRAGLRAAIATVAAAVGHPDRGVALDARIDAELAALGHPPGRGRVAAYYQRQGYLTGTGTLVDEMLRRVGLTNLAARLGRAPLSQLGLEQIALARPDFLVTDGEEGQAGDRGSAMLRHPILDRVVPRTHRLVVPQAMTACASPAYPRAIALLMRQVRAADAATARPSPQIRTRTPP